MAPLLGLHLWPSVVFFNHEQIERDGHPDHPSPSQGGYRGSSDPSTASNEDDGQHPNRVHLECDCPSRDPPQGKEVNMPILAEILSIIGIGVILFGLYLCAVEVDD